MRTLAKLESPYIVRYFHSWFEYPPVKWQKSTDEILMQHKYSYQMNNAVTLTSQFTSNGTGTTSIGSTAATDTTANVTAENICKKKKDIFSRNYNSNTNSSSFIVFENSNNEKEIQSKDDDTIDSWNDEDIQNECSNASSLRVQQQNSRESKSEAFYIYIQMELCQRETLRHWIDIYKYEKRESHHILNIFEQILHAISYIHSKDLIHRDLKVNFI